MSKPIQPSQEYVCERIAHFIEHRDITVINHLFKKFEKELSSRSYKMRLAQFIEKYAPVEFKGGRGKYIKGRMKPFDKAALRDFWWEQSVPEIAKPLKPTTTLSGKVEKLKKENSQLQKMIDDLNGQIAREDREIEKLKKWGYKE